MRLKRLDLTAFGPFTDKTLDFDEQCSLHVVYGPNESGKSSTLCGLRDFLYGFHPRTTENFLHPSSKLQVGGTFVTAQGETLDLVRWKKRVNSLTGPGGSPPATGDTLDFLNGIDKEIYDRLYSLSHHNLVSGAQALASEDGRVGESLFSASLGPEYRLVLDALSKEHEALWSVRPSKRPINQMIDLWKESTEKVREASLSSDVWNRLLEEREVCDRTNLHLKTEEARLNVELRRNREYQDAAPLAVRRQELKTELSFMACVPTLPPGYHGLRVGLQKEAESLALHLAKVRERELELTEELKKLKNDSPLFEFEERIDALHKRVGIFVEYRLELPGLKEHARSLHDKIALLTENGGLKEESVPSMTWRKRARNLAADIERTERSALDTRSDLEHLEEQLKRLSLEQPKVPLPDLNEVEQAVAFARKERQIDAEIRHLEETIQKETLKLQKSVEVLPYWGGGLEALCSLCLPTGSQVEEHHQRSLKTQQKLKDARAKFAEQRTRIKALERALSDHHTSSPVIARQDVVSCREQRDALWESLQKRWQAGEALHAHSGLVSRFSGSLKSADVLADRLASQGEDTVRFVTLDREMAEAKELLSTLKTNGEAIAEQAKAETADFETLWVGTQIQVQSPEDMLDWMQARSQILENLQELRVLELGLNQKTNRRVEELKALSQVAQSLAVTPFVASRGLGVAVDAVEERLNRLKRESLQRDAIEQKILEGRDRLELLKKKQSALSTDSEQLQKAWKALMLESPISKTIEPAEIEECLYELDELSQLIASRSANSERIAKIESELSAFDVEVDQLRPLLSLEGPNESADRFIEQLKNALMLAVREREKYHDLCSRKELAVQEIEEMSTQLRVKEKELTRHLAEVGLDDVEKAPDLEEKARLKSELRQELLPIEQRLRELGGNRTLDDYCEEVLQVDLQSLPESMARLQAQIEEVAQERERVTHEAGQLEERMQSLDVSSEAADCRQRAVDSEAEGRELLDRYVRLRLAERLLQEQMEQYRKVHEGPILESASRYFQELSNGAYRRLETGISQKTLDPILLAVSDSGRSVGVTEMSDGTRDQLFLALRLATIARRADNARTLPVIADDVLVQFDDQRAGSALRALMEFSGHTQVILFSHLERDFQLAKELNDSRVQLVRLESLNL